MALITRIFLTVLRTALPGSLCILAVLAARLALRRMPARFSYLLWAVVVFRLVCPLPPAAPFGLLPSSLPGLQGGTDSTITTPAAADGAAGAVPGGAAWTAPDTAAAAGGANTAGGITGSLPSPAAGPVSLPGMGLRQWAAVLWLAAALLLLGWQLVSLARLTRRMRRARQRAESSDPARPFAGGTEIVRLPGLESSFLFGLPCPRIYLPAGLDPKQERMILLHERAHLRRGDWLVRPLAWVLVCVYWFDPLVWLAYCLAMQDMERCCDEAALRLLGPGERQNYARTLLGMAAGRQVGPWAPAFGQGEIKGRIRHLLHCTKPARWALGLAAAGVAAVCAVLAFSPAKPEAAADEIAGWVYQYEKDGFGGDFTISLEEDGSFQYYEGPLSSYIGVGSWELDDGILTLRDDAAMGYPFVNRFEVKDGNLIFREEGSSNFMYLKLEDGERFLPARRVQTEDEPQPAQDEAGPEDALTFWVKPDEPPQVIGEVAATVWLNTQLDAAMPDDLRLAGYTLQWVEVLESAPPAGQNREEMPYQYLVRMTYDITTASEAYLAPGDGIAGLGSFAGLYRELGVKELEAGNYAIVSVGTGGGAAPFAADPELERAVQMALLGIYSLPDHPDAVAAESHTILYWEEVGNEPRAVRVYLLAMIKGGIGVTDGPGGVMQPREEFGPVRLTLIWLGEDEGWEPMEIWMLRPPEDTDAWRSELAEMFPEQAIAALLLDSSQNLDQRRDRLRAACDAVLFDAAAQSGPVDPGFFDNAAFVGDSLTQGLQIYESGLPNALYCAYNGIGPGEIAENAVLTDALGTRQAALDRLEDLAPARVYLLFGTQALAGDAGEAAEQAFLADYGRMIDSIRERLGENIPLCVQSIPPVRPQAEAQHPGLARERLGRVNELLAALAEQKGCAFLDLSAALADPGGSLAVEYAAGDGIHITADGYAAWAAYLCSHAG